MRGKALKKNQVDWSVFFKAVVTIALPIALQNFLSTTASMVAVSYTHLTLPTIYSV